MTTLSAEQLQTITESLSRGECVYVRVDAAHGRYKVLSVSYMPPFAITLGTLFDCGYAISHLNYGDEDYAAAAEAGEVGVQRYRESGQEAADLAAADERNNRAIARIMARGRLGYVRFGKLPSDGRSRNHRDNHTEAGVSVYRATLTPGGRKAVVHFRNTDQISAMFIVNRDCFEVVGEEVGGYGSDGEPLLRNPRIAGKVSRWIADD